jgi:hypothetical protein
MIRLNLGCGERRREGYVNIDKVRSLAADLVHDPIALSFYRDGTVAEVRIETQRTAFTRKEWRQGIAEWRRILRPGGLLIVSYAPNSTGSQEGPTPVWPPAGAGEGAASRSPGRAATTAGFDSSREFVSESLWEELETQGFETVKVRRLPGDGGSIPLGVELVARKANPCPERDGDRLGGRGSAAPSEGVLSAGGADREYRPEETAGWDRCCPDSLLSAGRG